jgi:TetR/AcrR family transcriptional regulator, mexJK operon transcriptional repressor
MSVAAKKIPETDTMPTKRDQIVDAACRLFLENGYELTSMDAVAAQANVSKRTVYSHFQSKETLFIDIMEDMCHLFGEGALDRIDMAARPADFLREAARFLRSKIMDPNLQALMRAIISQATAFPEMGQKFWATGPGTFQTVVAEYLRSQSAAGILDVPDPLLSASLFQGMVAGPYFLPMIFTGSAENGPEQTEKVIDAAVTLFLQGHCVSSRSVDLPVSQKHPISASGIGKHGG